MKLSKTNCFLGVLFSSCAADDALKTTFEVSVSIDIAANNLRLKQ